ncbi:Golgi apparatus membrane protein TVP38 [Artomyces pyxidatus]|uniref:Golgi apparatus membrane protein TVP38 n=1 Tax=Artomyces pyxidatus TaxID=48021 RepID=A0ACB8TKY0_9AGAM|nr:Golgi apparatus membrane protein TVP38 [Artomyces pyxidatus]
MALKGSRHMALPFQLLYHHVRAGLHRFAKLSLVGKLVIGFLVTFYIALLIAIIVISPARIGQFMYDTGQKIRSHQWGWALLAGLFVLVSFPPMVGHTTLLNLCGFTYGIKGFAIAGPGSVFGSAIVFVILRYMFSHKLRAWSSTNEKWQALETVVKAKGLPLMTLIRMSPFPPWVYSNSLFASIEVVALWQFMVATLCTSPKYLLYVFIGSRVAAMSDGKQREGMDTQTKIVNWILIIGGITVSVAAGWIIYVLMQRQLQGVSPVNDELAAEAIDDAEEGAPLLDNFSSESVELEDEA